MCTLMGLNNSNIVAIIQRNIALFDQFDEVHLFGSVLDDKQVPNDIDVLIIYSVYSDAINQETNRILHSLEGLIGTSVDLTVLSAEEERDTQFLNRILPRCLRLK